MRAGAWRFVVAVLGALALVAVPACGLSEDGEPVAIPPENLPPELLDPNPATTTSEPQPGEVPITVYLLEEVDDQTNALTAVRRQVADPADPADRLEALLEAQPTDDEAERGFFTSIPAELGLLEVEHDPAEGLLVVDLTGEIFDVQGRELSNAFAQLVWTATELETVTSVRFRVEGDPTPARDGSGGERDVLRRSDYRQLAPRS